VTHPQATKDSHPLGSDGPQAKNANLDEWIKMGRQYFEAGHLAEAMVEFKKILKVDPKNLDALQCSAAIAFGEDDFNKALVFLDRVVKFYPRFAAAHNNRGLALLELKRAKAALNSFDRAITLKPELTDAHFNRGNALVGLGKHKMALSSYNKAIEFNGTYSDAFANRGNAYRELKLFNDALKSFDEALIHKPNSFEAHFNRAKTYQDQNKFELAIEDFKKAIQIQPLFAEAHYELGRALKELMLFDDARTSYEKAIHLSPREAKFHHSLGVCFSDLRHYEQALVEHQKAISLDSSHLNAFIGCGVTLTELLRFDEAIEYYNQALKIDANSGLTRLNRSLLLLLKGDLEKGFREYESRWDALEGADKEVIAETRRRLSKPSWFGKESISGKTLFIYSEQGFGDTIQFCRYIKLLADLGVKVIFGVPGELRGLLSSLDGVTEFSLHGDRLPHYDYQCPLLSLPLALKTSLESIPVLDKYLAADSYKISTWQDKLQGISKPKVGIVWSGSTGHKKDFKRSILLQEFLGRIPDEFQYICLQKEIREVDRETLTANPQILNFADELNDFSDTAALIECLDLVISVDTSVAHLSAALGKPTWILLPTTPDWRWLLNRSDSPWYPSVKLYRQKKIGEWEGVLEGISEDLKLKLIL